jgi:hypothetical protein
MANIPYPSPAGNINDYNAIPTTPYRQFVDAIQAEIKRVNALSIPDSQRLEVFKAALLMLQDMER